MFRYGMRAVLVGLFVLMVNIEILSTVQAQSEEVEASCPCDFSQVPMTIERWSSTVVWRSFPGTVGASGERCQLFSPLTQVPFTIISVDVGLGPDFLVGAIPNFEACDAGVGVVCTCGVFSADVGFTPPVTTREAFACAATINNYANMLDNVAGIVVMEGEGVPCRTAPSVVTFAAFTAKVEVELRPRRDDAFAVQSSFAIGASSNGIDPLTEDVTLELTGGTTSFTTTIPAGSFTKEKNGRFEFEGTINGVDLQAKITPVGRHGFKCKVEGEHADLTGIANPVTVTLTIGNDSGNTTVRAQFDQHKGDHGDGEDGEH
jgi:hypothetical protein